MNNQIREAIYHAVDDHNQQSASDQQLEKSPSAVLFGNKGQLDSLGLVSFIVEVEQKIETDLGIAIVLADERALSHKHNPFASLQDLENYIATLIKEDGSNQIK